MADARERHVAEIEVVKQQLRTMYIDTPHRRDLLKHLHRMQKELKEYDHYRGAGTH